MIKTALVAMTIVGCDCDAKLCEYIGETPAKWSNLADCEAAMKSQVLRHKSFDYPLVSGVCRTVQKPASKLAAAPATPDNGPPPVITDEIAALGLRRPEMPIGPSATAVANPDFKPTFYDTMVDGGRAVLYRTENGYALVKTGLSQTVSSTASAMGRSAGWLSAQLPSP
ncbi:MULTISPECIES: hypothetical protein [Phyllobacteriaceae]|mgnify:CR=1 FL=1|uniref:Uncharacterized protein n=1 Tax=Mesorhizobium hungaricum TaxID=1566387 RepID=A0A1C2ECI4_9HYPH|nr:MULTISPECIES: hypothetical protein [Mesorhizobium]MBN9237493.1 hypothetical protein [Mesorhizobium sp.]MDQ0329020.1 hypothetical protein [Mesorhizobium sp. YL-MeA3-2017]OCX24784.1 hypothetical protein QV13_01585 [Mesorhizobium hungaricum]